MAVCSHFMQKIAKLQHIKFITFRENQLSEYRGLVELDSYINKIYNNFKIRYYYKLNILFWSP